jgi:hypothetical protein
MRRGRRSPPRWLQELLEQVAAVPRPTGQPPHWQEDLHSLRPQRLLLRGTLRYPAPTGEPAALRSAEAGVRCSLGRPVTSSRGVHGLYLFLADETQAAEVSALLLTPAAYAQFRSTPAREYANVRTCSLAEPFAVLETDRLRAEFAIRDVIYDPAHPELELLLALTLEVTVWQHPG